MFLSYSDSRMEPFELIEENETRRVSNYYPCHHSPRQPLQNQTLKIDALRIQPETTEFDSHTNSNELHAL
jgi:hypothetical protein